MLSREEQVPDRLLLVVRDRREVARLIARVRTLRERVRRPMLQVDKEVPLASRVAAASTPG